MLKDILDAALLSSDYCADLLSVPRERFAEWAEGRPIPKFILPEILSILGISEKDLTSKPRSGYAAEGVLAPAVWYKLRDTKLNRSDREMVGVIRKLGFYMGQLDKVRGTGLPQYPTLFAEIRKRGDAAASPAVQGQLAAEAFRAMSGLSKGQRGIGEVIRTYLRASGLLLVESPLPESTIEGCCFKVDVRGDTRACLFANSYKSTWFRRNAVLAHELSHAIFDVETEQVSIDYLEEESNALNEQRAQAFAQDFLVPRSVLSHYTSQMGIDWSSLSTAELAALIAGIHVEQNMLLNAAVGTGLITADQAEYYKSIDCSDALREASSHALSTPEFLSQTGNESANWVADKRWAKIGAHRLLLPVGYVDRVLEAVRNEEISIGKAAEMLMTDEETFIDRFGDLVPLAA
jgi:Zn-dependent peptidase ImmA (M78 family)